MAVFKSSIATNAFASPVVKTGPENMGRVYNYGASYSIPNTNPQAGDVVLMFPIPTTYSVRRVRVWSDGAGTAGAFDLGLYRANSDGTILTEVDKDLFASALAIDGPVAGVDHTAEAGFVTIDERFKKIWEVAGASEDPGGAYWVALTMTTAVGGGATLVAVEIEGTL